MTTNNNLLSSYELFAIPKKVKIANDSSLQVTEIGKVRINDQLTLHNVLHVPSINFNMLSVGKISRDNNCLAYFISPICYFQEKEMNVTFKIMK